jgi:hypothetical protein
MAKNKLKRINEFMKRNKSFCPAAFHEIYADNSGRYRLCCHARPIPEFKNMDFKEEKHLPFDYFLSDAMEEVRQKMLEGETIPACKTCYSIEKKSPDGSSYRTKMFEKHGMNTEVNRVNLKVRFFGNYCNLSCYMCHPFNSTSRGKELKEIFPKSNKEDYDNFIAKQLANDEGINIKYSDWDNYFNHILENIDLIRTFQMMGGETLQLPKYWEMLDRIPKDKAKNIRVSAQTNLTEIRYKNFSVFDTADKFEQLTLGASVDHYGDKLSFMRYPIDPQVFENNLQEIIDGGVRYSLDLTVSILNIDELDEIRKYYKDKFSIPEHINLHFSNVVRGPEYLSIRNLPQRMKDRYLEKYHDLTYVVAELREEPNQPVDKFIAYCDKLWLHRGGTDWKILWKDFLDDLHQQR